MRTWGATPLLPSFHATRFANPFLSFTIYIIARQFQGQRTCVEQEARQIYGYGAPLVLSDIQLEVPPRRACLNLVLDEQNMESIE